MERQAIERLAMDAALGELNDDAEILLNTYLAEHPDAKQWAQQIRTVCTRTQEVIDMKTLWNPVPMGTTATPARWRVSVHWARVARWAAVVMASLLIGAGIGRWPGPRAITPTPNVAVETTRSPGPRSWQEILSKPGKGFWESKAAAIWQSEPHPKTTSQPSLWETLKQVQKERSHE